MKIYKVKVNGKTYEVQLESVDEVKTESATSSEAKTKEAPKKETSKKCFYLRIPILLNGNMVKDVFPNICFLLIKPIERLS